MSDFKRASKLKREEIEEIIRMIPTDRAGRIAAILATIEAHPEGINVQWLISTLSHRWGLTRGKIVDYFETLNRVGKTYVGSDLKVYLRKKDEE